MQQKIQKAKFKAITAKNKIDRKANIIKLNNLNKIIDLTKLRIETRYQKLFKLNNYNRHFTRHAVQTDNTFLFLKAEYKQLKFKRIIINFKLKTLKKEFNLKLIKHTNEQSNLRKFF